MKIPKDAQAISDQDAQRMAAILGDSSGIAKAIKDAEEKRKSGLDVTFAWSRAKQMIFVVSGK